MTDQKLSQLTFAELPEGTVTFLFTDIEGSTQLLSQLGEAYAALLADQRRILREAFTRFSGQEVDTQGDAFFVAFPRATQAVAAAVEVQRGLAGHEWPEGASVKVRMGLHTGEPWVSEEGYVGMDVHRAARIAHVGHGGQVLLSETTAALALDELPEEVSSLDLGRHLLKDLHRPEHIRQLVIEGLECEFPPLTSLEVLLAKDMRQPRQVGECPYRGLAAFKEADAPFYYGRESFTEKLHQAVRTQPMVAVIVGSSGSGKSSAVFAGLLPRLREEGGWEVTTFRPGSQPFYGLAGTLSPLLEPDLSEADRLVETKKLAGGLMADQINLNQVAERIVEKSPTADRILLIIDQFEELYTLCPDEQMRLDLIDQLLAAVEAGETKRRPPLAVFLTMRADFMGQALTHRPFADALQESSLILGPMNREELRSAVEKPAEMQGAAFEPGLVERILDDVGEKPGNLPLLEFTLTQLWEVQQDGWLTHTDYERMGCVEGALASYADQVYVELGDEEQERARRVFVQLVRPGEGTEDTRRVAFMGELGEKNWGLVQHLADKRLVVSGRNAEGEQTAEVVHEALIQRWDRFREWMEADRSFRTWQERLRGAMSAWESSERDEDALLRGVPLMEAEGWLEKRGHELSDAELDFIQNGVALRERRQRERDIRRRRVVVGLSVGLVVAVLLSILAVWQWQRADSASLLAGFRQETAQAASTQAIAERAAALTAQALEAAQKLIAQGNAEARATAQANADDARDAALREAEVSRSLVLAANAREEYEAGHTDLALHLVMEAASIDDPPDEVMRAMSELAFSTGSVARYEWYQEGEWSAAVAFSPDGRYVASASNLGGLLLWDLDTDQEFWRIQAHDLEVANVLETDYLWGIRTVGFTPDGEKVFTGSLESEDIIEGAKLWDVRTGNMIIELPGYNDNLGLSPDGRYYVSAELGSGGGSDIVVWDVVSGQELQRFPSTEGQVLSAAFSPDGSRIVSGESDPASLRLWDVESGDQIKQINVMDSDMVVSVSFSPDGRSIYSVSSFDWRIWDVETGLEFRRDDYPGTVLGLSHSSSGKYSAFTNFGSSRWFLWDNEHWSALQIFDNTIEGTLTTDTAFSPDENSVLVAHTDGSVRLWDLTRPGLVRQWINKELAGFSVDVNPDGKQLIGGFSNSQVYLWDIESGSQLLRISNIPAGVWDVDFSPDGEYVGIVSADFWGGTRNNALVIWDLKNDKEHLRLDTSPHLFEPDPDSEEGNYYVYRFKFSPDGNTILTGSILATGCCDVFGSLVLWDAYTGEMIHELESGVGDYLTLEYTSDSQRAVALEGFQNRVKVFDLQTGEILSQFLGDEHGGAIFSIALHPDEKRLITAADDGTMYMRELETGEILHHFTGHRGGIMDVEISPDGTRAVSVSFEGEFLLWDAETGELLRSYVEHEGTVMDVEFSPDGRTAFSIATDGKIIQWQVVPLSLEEILEWVKINRVYRDLTPQECEQYHLTSAVCDNN